MRSFVSSLARKVIVPAALALGALVAVPSVGPAPAQAAAGYVGPGVVVVADPAIVPVHYHRRRHYAPHYYAPPPAYYYRRPAYGPRYYAPPPPPRYYRQYGPRYYYR